MYHIWTLVAHSLNRRALGFSVFRIWPFFRLVFRFLHWTTSVFRFCCALRFLVFPFFSIWFFGFLAKRKQFRSLCESLCSQMLGYFICFYFTVNPGQTALWDSACYAGYLNQRVPKPVYGILNPQCGIQNPRLSWIPLHWVWYYVLFLDLRVHVGPIPMYPGLHVQLLDPSVLLQIALTSHSMVVCHTLINIWKEEKCSNFRG